MMELYVYVGWGFFAGFCLGALVYYSKGIARGVERAMEQIRHQQEMEAYSNYINSMRG
jgi:hypothetical protein